MSIAGGYHAPPPELTQKAPNQGKISKELDHELRFRVPLIVYDPRNETPASMARRLAVKSALPTPTSAGRTTTSASRSS